MVQPVRSDERRSSPRVPVQVPVEIGILSQTHQGATLEVNDLGGLVLLPNPAGAGTLLTLTNLQTGESGIFRVATAWPRDTTGYPIGIAMLGGSARAFWGDPYEAVRTRGH